MKIFTEDQAFFWGEAHFPDGGFWGPVCEPFLGLYMVFKGRSEIIINKEVQMIKPGETGLTCNEGEVDYQLEKNMYHYVAWCETPKPLMQSDVYKKIKELPFTLKTTDRLAQLMELGLQPIRKGNHESTELKNALGRAIFLEYFNQAKLILDEKPLPDLVKRVKTYIEEHYTDDCNAKSIAEYAGVTPRYLLKLFRKHVDSSPVDYLWQLRMKKAVRLLTYQGLTVSEIAYQCGFKNPFHFSRYVKQQYGVSPTELRKQSLFLEDPVINQNV